MSNSSVPVITIDGPSGVGKGTTAQRIASHLGWHLLDSGAIYRVLAEAARQQGVALDDEPALVQLAESLDVRFVADPDTAEIQILLEGHEVSEAVRSEASGQAASQVAALPAVRTALLARQRSFRRSPGLVADGRDMGTVVFPNAPLKVFLSASPQERAQRRYKQLIKKGMDANLASLIETLAERDARDRDRACAPLQAATDALLIDTTALSIDAVVARILDRLNDRS